MGRPEGDGARRRHTPDREAGRRRRAEAARTRRRRRRRCLHIPQFDANQEVLPLWLLPGRCLVVVVDEPGGHGLQVVGIKHFCSRS